MEERFVIKKNQNPERYFENIYNTLVVICSSQKEYEGLHNFAPIAKSRRRDANRVNAFFINYPECIDLFLVSKIVLFYQCFKRCL